MYCTGRLATEGINIMDEIKYYDEFNDACAKALPEKNCRKYFKIYEKELPRIVKSIGFLKNISPNTILDIGPGKGRALWPIANALPNTSITCVEKSVWRHTVIDAVNKGGIKRISSLNIDVSEGLPFSDNSFDVTTAFEVIEHIRNYNSAIEEIFRVTRDFIMISVPSKPDKNPDHINFFTMADFEMVLSKAEEKTGKDIKKTTFGFIPKHMLIVIKF